MKPASTPTRDYSTGRAASELHVSPSHVRALCQSGMIAARATQGGHWRIPRDEVERLRREGIPSPPSLTPTEPESDSRVPASPNPYRHPNLLAEPSEDAISAADEVVQLENEVKAIGLKRAREESLDWFRDRERRQLQAKAARDQQRLEARALQVRRDWENAWVEYALENISEDAPENVCLPISEFVRQALVDREPDDPEEVIEPLVRAAVDNGLQPWRRSKEIERAIQEARNQLPYWAKAYPGPSEWELKAICAASTAIGELRNEATADEIRAAAIAAGRAVTDEYQHIEVCRQIVGSVFLFQTPNEQDKARQAVKAAIGILPVGNSRMQLERVRDEMLAPFKAAEDAVRVREQATRQADSYLFYVDSYLEQIAVGRSLGNPSQRYQLAQELKEKIRPVLVQEILDEPLGLQEARTFIESLIDRRL